MTAEHTHIKTVGIVVTVFGCLLLLSAIKVATTKYDLSSTHDISKCFGAFGFAAGVTAAGVFLLRRGKKKDP
jgi:hypothetical protein